MSRYANPPKIRGYLDHKPHSVADNFTKWTRPWLTYFGHWPVDQTDILVKTVPPLSYVDHFARPGDVTGIGDGEGVPPPPHQMLLFGTVVQWTDFPADYPATTSPGGYPDSNNIPISKGPATGTQMPWNLMRNDDPNPVHQSQVNDSAWQSGMTTTQSYCQSNGMSLMFQMYYPTFDGSVSWATMQPLLVNLATYLTGFPVYIIIVNEFLNGQSTISDYINQPPWSDLGGSGSTGIDGFIAWVKQLRTIFPSNCKLGLNEFDVCDQTTNQGTNTNFKAAVTLYNLCAANGAPLDFIGCEGYWMNNYYTGYMNPFQMVTTLCDQWGSATGVPIIYSEFTPMVASSIGPGYYGTQILAWQALLDAISSNQWVLGVVGPWGGIRFSEIWRDGNGSEQRNWMWNDTASNAGGDPNNTGNIAPGAITSTLPWLQQWVSQDLPLLSQIPRRYKL